MYMYLVEWMPNPGETFHTLGSFRTRRAAREALNRNRPMVFHPERTINRWTYAHGYHIRAVKVVHHDR